MRSPPVPRCHRLGISLQPALLGLSLRFHVGVLLATIWWQFLGVALKNQSSSAPYVRSEKAIGVALEA